MSFEEFGTSFGRVAVGRLANSQLVLLPRGAPEPLTPPFKGLFLGGGHGLEIAQSRCPWWIEGMLRLLKAIEDAPEPTPRIRRLRKPKTLKPLLGDWGLEPVNA